MYNIFVPEIAGIFIGLCIIGIVLMIKSVL